MTQKNEINKLIEPIFTKTSLVEKVEFFVKRDNMGYTEAMIHICKEYELDPEDLAKIVSPPLKEKMKIEAESLSLLKQKTKRNKLLFFND